MVFSTAYRITGNPADAEDVLQTVFLRLLRRSESSGALLQRESYLRRAAINVALDVVRSGKSARSVPIDDLPTDRAITATPTPGPESAELRNELRRALAHLQPREAEIFALRFFEERSNQEIARMLQISQVHVAVILHRTRRQLQKEIGGYLGEGERS